MIPMPQEEAHKLKQRIGRIVDLFFEAGMLRFTPRSGWAFLGSGKENVAEHSFRVALMSFVLATLAGKDACKAAAMGLFHDLHEARTGDLNYLQQRYDSSQQRRAQHDAIEGTGAEKAILGLFDEFEQRETPEAMLVKDADQLDMLFNLKVELEQGNTFAEEWIGSALKRLRTEEGRAVAEAMLKTHSSNWWHGNVDPRWWIDKEAKYNEGGQSGPEK